MDNNKPAPKGGPVAACPTVDDPACLGNDPTITVPARAISRVAVLLGFAYEATWTAADDGELDWSTIGEPLAEARAIVRELWP